MKELVWYIVGPSQPGLEGQLKERCGIEVSPVPVDMDGVLVVAHWEKDARCRDLVAQALAHGLPIKGVETIVGEDGVVSDCRLCDAVDEVLWRIVRNGEGL